MGYNAAPLLRLLPLVGHGSQSTMQINSPEIIHKLYIGLQVLGLQFKQHFPVA